MEGETELEQGYGNETLPVIDNMSQDEEINISDSSILGNTANEEIYD